MKLTHKYAVRYNEQNDFLEIGFETPMEFLDHNPAGIENVFLQRDEQTGKVQMLGIAAFRHSRQSTKKPVVLLAVPCA